MNLTTIETEHQVGEQLRALRLGRNIDQQTLAERAGISLRAVKNIESGSGSTLRTLVLVARALGREDWFAAMAPVATIDTLATVRSAKPRQRARRRAAPAMPVCASV